MNSLLRSVSMILSGRIIRLLLMLLFMPILVRLLSQDEYGLFAYLMAIVGITTVVAPLGLFDAVRKHIAEHTTGSSEEAGITIVALLLSSAYALLVAFALLGINHTLEFVPDRFTVLLIGIILGNNLFQVCRGVFYGRQREQIPEIAATIRQALYVGIGLAAAYYGFGVVGVFTVYVFALVIVAVSLFVLTASTLNSDVSFREATSVFATPMGQYGLVQAVGGVAAVLLYKTDIVLVEFFHGSTETALYQAALLPAEYVWFVPSAIQMALLQNTANHWAQDEIEEINHNVRNGLIYTSLALVLFGVGLFVLAEEFVTVYFGPKYQSSALPLRILLVGTVFFGLNRVFVPVLQATGWLRYTEALTVVALLLNVVLNALLIPWYGIVGAAIGTASSYVFMFVGGAVLWQYSRFTSLTIREIGQLCGTFVAFTGTFWILVHTVSLPGLAALFVFPGIGFGLFVTFVLLFEIATIDELKEIMAASLRDLR